MIRDESREYRGRPAAIRGLSKAGACLPDGWRFVEVAGVATDSRDRVFVFNRGDHPVVIFDRDGRFLDSWGENVFARPHGITIGPDDTVYCTDDLDHTVKKFTPEGTLLLTLGKSGSPSDTGATSMDFRTIRPPVRRSISDQPGIRRGRFMYIADGYGNARIHRFRRTAFISFLGRARERAWRVSRAARNCRGPDGTVVVADRENSRLQFFSPDGRFLKEWTDVARPCQVLVDDGGECMSPSWASGRGCGPERPLRARTRPEAG